MEGIHPAHPAQFERLAELWEASVRATHDFLPEATIAALRPLVRDHYLAAVTLRIYQDAQGDILGFVGVAEGKVEMLFIDPRTRGRGIGKRLLRHAIDVLGATTVDVNEQNPQAVGFYLHEGFVVQGRSPLDGQGQPHPLLHLALGEARAAPSGG